MKELSEEEKEIARLIIRGIIADDLGKYFHGGLSDNWNELPEGENRLCLLLGLEEDSSTLEQVEKALEELYAPKYNRIYT